VGLSVLLVSDNRARPRPKEVGRVAKENPTSFYNQQYKVPVSGFDRKTTIKKMKKIISIALSICPTLLFAQEPDSTNIIEGGSLPNVTITAQTAKDGKTPVAVSTIYATEIENKLGSSDFPMILKCMFHEMI